MLSLGKLATGQAGYYLEQAHGSLSRARSVSSGVEDYYLGGPEAAGEWMGAGAGALGLKGDVGGGALDHILAVSIRRRARRSGGCSPRGGQGST